MIKQLPAPQADRDYISDIPEEAEEKVVSFYAEDENAREEGGMIHYERREYLLDGELVGYRQFDHKGRLIIETPMKDQKKHGTEYSWYWYEPDQLSLSEPYEHGLVHGTAKQWDIHGNLMGTYAMNRGTGFDIWRDLDENGNAYIAEIHSLQHGKLHGFQWWFNEDGKTVNGERHWLEGFLNGIARKWDEDGNLFEHFPQYYVDDKQVSKRFYETAAKNNLALPAYNDVDDDYRRSVIEEIFSQGVYEN